MKVSEDDLANALCEVATGHDLRFAPFHQKHQWKMKGRKLQEILGIKITDREETK